MTANPIEKIEVPKLERKLPSKLTKQDAMGILEAVDNYPYQSNFLQFRNYAIFASLIMSGIRKQELNLYLNRSCNRCFKFHGLRIKWSRIIFVELYLLGNFIIQISYYPSVCLLFCIL